MEFAWRFDSSAVLLRQSKMYATPIYPPFTNSFTYTSHSTNVIVQFLI